MAEKNTDKKNLFSEFEPVKTEEWEDLLTRDLKGADYKKKLRWESAEGIEALPFYRREELEKLPHIERGIKIHTPAEWQFCEVIDTADPKEANQLALQAIKGGADSLWLTIQITSDGGLLGGDIRGIHVQSLDDLKILLNGIDLNKTGIVFNSGVGSVGILALMKAYLQSTGETHPSDTPAGESISPLERGFISFLFDPFTYMAAHGRLPLPEDELNAIIWQLAAESDFKSLAVEGAFYHNCGATIIQEVGIALAIGSEFLARMPVEKREQAAKQIWMHLSAGSLYFPEIAKFRAVRLLWDRVLYGYGIKGRNELPIHASTSQWNKSVADPYNNMLRATTEATAAALGGADRITIHPFDAPFKQSNSMSRRIARNVSHILDEEVHLSAVENPADGAYYVEVLTDEIARKAWEFFRLIENQGGFQKALEAKIIQGEISRAKKAKDDALATRKLVLTGVNHYAEVGQELPESLFRSSPADSLQQSAQNTRINPFELIESLSKAFSEDAKFGDVSKSFLQPEKQLYPALKTYRAAVPFEELRLQTQKIAAERGKEITAQLVPIGNKKMRKARATFSQNYLECAGFKVNNHSGFDSVKDAAIEHKSKKADIFVLCGFDEEYPALVPEFCSVFGEGTTLILAGYPKDKIDEYKNAGIDEFIYSGSNMLETLRGILEKVQALPSPGKNARGQESTGRGDK